VKAGDEMLRLADALGVKVIAEPWAGGGLQLIMYDTYEFWQVTLDDVVCLFAEPRCEIPTVQAAARQFERIREVAGMPVALKLNELSGERRKGLIAAKVPFVATEQIYLPFMGAVLRERLYAEPTSREKLMPSAQLVLFSYLYQASGKLYPGKLTGKLAISAMQITRAVRQLQKLNLFEVSKDGVQVVIEGKLPHEALFEAANPHLLDPVRDIVYVSRDSVSNLPFGGISALAETTMLADDIVPTFAYYSKSGKLNGESNLSDCGSQVRVEVWKYAPTLLSDNPNTADPLSVIVSLGNALDDPRVEQAANEIYRKLWR
jgi:hypothetical protein